MNFIKDSIARVSLLENTQLLIIDNDRDSLYLYTTLLEEYGANVLTATSVEEALSVFGWFLPDIVICEMRFCSENVDMLITKLSAMEKISGNHIPAIAITTWISDTFAKVLDTSFERYMLKPINLDILVSTIESLLLPNRTNFLNGILSDQSLHLTSD